jgi:hypothetical protein
MVLSFGVYNTILLFAISFVCLYNFTKNRHKKKQLDSLQQLTIVGIIIGVVFGSILFLYAPEIDFRTKGIGFAVSVGIYFLIIYRNSLNNTKVRKKLGGPCKISSNRVQFYLSRSYLPFEEVVGAARKEIIFLSISHEIVAQDKEHIIREAIVNRNIRIKVMILHPRSRYVHYQEHVFGIGVFSMGRADLDRTLERRITDSLQNLDNIKARLPEEKRNNLTIETYDYDLSTSLMIIDHGTKNACIKIEEHYSTEGSRQNKLVFFEDNEEYYQTYYEQYENASKPRSGSPILSNT